MSAQAQIGFRTYLAITVSTNAVIGTSDSILALINAALALVSENQITGAWREVLIQSDPDNVANGGGVGNIFIGDSQVKSTPVVRCGYKLKIGDTKQYRDVANTVPLANLRVACDSASLKINIELLA